MSMLDVDDFTAPDHRCSDFLLDRLQRGELPADDVAVLEAHLAQSSVCAERRALLLRASADYQARARPLVFDLPSSTVAPVKPQRRRQWTWAVAASSLAAAAGVVLLVQPADDGVRTKGSGGVDTQFFVLRDGHVQPASSKVVAGDVVRARVHSPTPVGIAIFEVDPAGVVSPLFPSRGGLLAVTGAVELPEARELDASTGTLDWVTLVCPATTAVDVNDAAVTAQIAGQTAPASCVLVHHPMQKVAR
jgi:anti-sigma factor RsiW